MNKILSCLSVFLFILCGCATNKKISEDQIYHKLNWDGKEIIFYKTSELAYSDGEKTYNMNYQMLDSKDGTKRMYITFNGFNDMNYIVAQDGKILEPIDSFNYLNLEGIKYEEAFELLKKLNVVEDSLVLSDIDVDIYVLDKSKKTTVGFDETSNFISKKWMPSTDTMLRGSIVDFTLEELQQMVDSWEKVTIARNQIEQTSRTLQVSWTGTKSTEFIYSTGDIHIPEFAIFTVISNDKQYIEVENRLDFYDASITHYELSNQQWQKFNEWYANLK